MRNIFQRYIVCLQMCEAIEKEREREICEALAPRKINDC